MKMLRLVMNVAFAAMCFKLALATDYTVGSPSGSWDKATNLQSWADSQAFSVGDNLIFQYTVGHDVMEVPKSDYDTCQSSNAILTDTTGKSTIPLTKPGKRYFICGTPGHCASGMKMEVNVLAAATSAAPSPLASSPATLPDGDVTTLSPFGSPVAAGGPTGSPTSVSTTHSSSAVGRGSALFRPVLVFVNIGALIMALGFLG